MFSRLTKKMLSAVICACMIFGATSTLAYTSLDDGAPDAKEEAPSLEYDVLKLNDKLFVESSGFAVKSTTETESGIMAQFSAEDENPEIKGIPMDIKDLYDTLSLKIYSEKATGSKLYVLLNSTKASGNLRYYKETVTVDWVGWKTFEFLFVDMNGTRSPSLEELESLKFSFTWDQTEPDPSTVVAFGDIRFIKRLDSTGKGTYSTKYINLELAEKFYDLSENSVGIYAYRNMVYQDETYHPIDSIGNAVVEKNGVIMVPVSVFDDYLGINVESSNTNCTITNDSNSLNVQAGSLKYEVTSALEDEDGENINADFNAAPFFQNGAFYVPAEQSAKLLGLTVIPLGSGLLIDKNPDILQITENEEMMDIAKFKIGHIDRVLSDITKEDFEKAKKNLKTNLIGDNNDMTNPYVAKRIHEWEAAAEESRATMNRSSSAKTLWGEPTQTDAKITSVNFSAIYDMAKAYGATGSKYYKDKTLLADITYALDWMSENIYGESARQSSNRFGNWWYWMIGAPRHQLRALMCIYEDLSREQIEKYTHTINTIMPRTRYEGGNAAWSIYIVIMAGLLTNDAEKVLLAAEDMTQFWVYGESDSAVYRDGSIVDHHFFAYNGGYGSNLINDLSEAVLCLTDTLFFPTDPNIEMQIEWIKNCFAPFVYDGMLVPGVTGRNISRGGKTAQTILSGMLYILHYAKPSDAEFIKSFIKHQAMQYDDNMMESVAMGEIEALTNILKDDRIIPSANYEFSRMFFNMDRIMHYGNNFAFSISMSSERTRRYECINGENQQGWYTADGMVYTYYRGANEQNHSEYYKNLDYTRIPGATTDKQEREASSVSTYDSDRAFHDFVGGASLDNKYTVGTMDFSGANEPARTYTASSITYDTKAIASDVSAKKSWFLFEDEMVALGCDINSTKDPGVETTIDNRMLTEKNIVSANGENLPAEIYNKTINNLSWAAIDGLGGYVFPYGDDMNIETVENSGTKYVQIYKNHGVNPTDGKYAYISLPGKTKEQTKEYSLNPAVEILANNSEIQAVRKASSGVTQMVFRKAGELDAVQVDIPCAVVVKEDKETVSIAISDPTQKLKNGKLVLDMKGLSLLTADKGVNVSGGENEPVTVNLDFTVSPQAGFIGDSYMGITYTIVLRKG